MSAPEKKTPLTRDAYRVVKQYEGLYYVLDQEGERAASVAKFMPGPMVSVAGQGAIYSPALAKAIASAMRKLANEIERAS